MIRRLLALVGVKGCDEIGSAASARIVKTQGVHTVGQKDLKKWLMNNLQDKMVDYYANEGVGYAQKISRGALYSL